MRRDCPTAMLRLNRFIALGTKRQIGTGSTFNEDSVVMPKLERVQ